MKSISEDLEEYGITGIEQTASRVAIRNYIIRSHLTEQERKARAEEIKEAIQEYSGKKVLVTTNSRQARVSYIYPKEGRVLAYVRWTNRGGAFKGIEELEVIPE